MGGRFTTTSRPGPSLVDGLGEGSGTPQDTAPSLFPGPPSSRTSPRPSESGGLRKKAKICVLAHSPPEDHHSTNGWLNGPTVPA